MNWELREFYKESWKNVETAVGIFFTAEQVKIDERILLKTLLELAEALTLLRDYVKKANERYNVLHEREIPIVSRCKVINAFESLRADEIIYPDGDVFKTEEGEVRKLIRERDYSHMDVWEGYIVDKSDAERIIYRPREMTIAGKIEDDYIFVDVSPRVISEIKENEIEPTYFELDLINYAKKSKLEMEKYSGIYKLLHKANIAEKLEILMKQENVDSVYKIPGIKTKILN